MLSESPLIRILEWDEGDAYVHALLESGELEDPDHPQHDQHPQDLHAVVHLHAEQVHLDLEDGVQQGPEVDEVERL